MSKRKITYSSKFIKELSKKTTQIVVFKNKKKRSIHSYIGHLNKSSFVKSFRSMQKELTIFSEKRFNN
jgi:hypothetical protein